MMSREIIQYLQDHCHFLKSAVRSKNGNMLEHSGCECYFSMMIQSSGISCFLKMNTVHDHGQYLWNYLADPLSSVDGSADFICGPLLAFLDEAMNLNFTDADQRNQHSDGTYIKDGFLLSLPVFCEQGSLAL